jgi:hypothetical protein
MYMHEKEMHTREEITVNRGKDKRTICDLNLTALGQSSKVDCCH